MNTKDAVRIVWHFNNVEAAREILDKAAEDRCEAYKSVNPGEDEYVAITLNGNEPYMIHVDIDGGGDHKVIRLSKTTPGDETVYLNSYVTELR